METIPVQSNVLVGDLVRADTRTTLLDAAERLFSERGYAAVGVREIVEAAGANVAAVNYHFGTKRELYVETVRRALDRSGGEAMWRMLDETDGSREATAAALARFIRAFFTKIVISEQPSAACSLMVAEASQPSEACDGVIENFIRPNQSRLAAAVATIDPSIDRSACVLHATSIIGQILHYRVFRTFIERSGVARLDEEADLLRIADHIASFTLRALGMRDDEVSAALACTFNRGDEAPSQEDSNS